MLGAREEPQHLLPRLYVLLHASRVYVRQQRLVRELTDLRAHRLYVDRLAVVCNRPLALPRQLVNRVVQHLYLLLDRVVCIGVGRLNTAQQVSRRDLL